MERRELMMPQLGKYDINGNQIGDIDLSDAIFNEKINENVIYQVVSAQLASIRKGNASTKTRGEVSGGGRKPWRQKGTGRARHGSIRSPLWVGGGIIFGPKPRSYQKKVPRKLKRIALKSIFSDKINGDNIKIIDKMEFNQPKTKNMVELLKNLQLEDKKVLIILPEKNENIYLSARNISSVKTLLVDALNAYDLLNNDYILMSEEAVQKVEEVLSK
jgi:large subunit ribosomal protein L4